MSEERKKRDAIDRMAMRLVKGSQGKQNFEKSREIARKAIVTNERRKSGG